MSRSLLLPLTPAYRIALAVRESRLRSGREPVRRLQWAVVSIGNLSAGGAGKTPLVIALARALTRRGLHVDVLSRGYGRSSSGAVRVDPNGTAEQFGDEPLVIAREACVPVFVAAERYKAGVLAEAEVGADSERVRTWTSTRQPGWSPAVHLLDDGFQHRQLARDVDIVLLSRRDWRDRLLPAGNLREPLTALHRAHIVAIPADEPELEADLKATGWTGPIWHLRRCMEVAKIDGPAVAFCGIARPEQFFVGLESAGLHLAARIAFRDHHRYSKRDLDRLVRTTRETGAAVLITTEKDRARIGNFASGLPLTTTGLRTEIEDEEAAINDLLRRLRQVP